MINLEKILETVKNRAKHTLIALGELTVLTGISYGLCNTYQGDAPVEVGIAYIITYLGLTMDALHKIVLNDSLPRAIYNSFYETKPKTQNPNPSQEQQSINNSQNTNKKL